MDEDERVPCEACEGRGFHWCECIRCADVHDRKCDKCDGKGDVINPCPIETPATGESHD